MVVDQLQKQAKFEDASNFIEVDAHLLVHTHVASGTMGSIPIASRDPIFYAHHAYVDRLFGWWQEYHTARGVDTSTCESCPDKMLRFYNQPMIEWMGQYSKDKGCTLLPRSDPVACLSFAAEMPHPESEGW